MSSKVAVLVSLGSLSVKAEQKLRGMAALKEGEDLEQYYILHSLSPYPAPTLEEVQRSSADTAARLTDTSVNYRFVILGLRLLRSMGPLWRPPRGSPLVEGRPFYTRLDLETVVIPSPIGRHRKYRLCQVESDCRSILESWKTASSPRFSELKRRWETAHPKSPSFTVTSLLEERKVLLAAIGEVAPFKSPKVFLK